ncbi:type II CRISPR RNA-guided endonuclease Cas9 [Berryella wangjianweii]|uniref:CRISPR-associated endonuclease Cas9 n=1 Tax=Berryella wangjianweii TaxID=2734634 RepID=A0A6M8J0W2_9ACTN|nr:type II CRISPR RNA-guided endonuclease Cas9 [Berryella wangjianweii]QKF07164.1 type II CRISPR RNA-guided endonuclease Cas9 [Berryella wangjianweii]
MGKKLRGAQDYSIGLDLGTGSVGWAAVANDGELLSFKGKGAFGSRLFEGAKTAADTRVHRGMRRRIARRRQRLDFLQDIFQDHVEAVDSEFFHRLRQSRLHPSDREEGHSDYRWPLFNGSDFNEVDYYERFPTIYHLREWLMDTPEKADIRLIYLAFHNIVKVRGNFLRQDDANLTSQNANMSASLVDLADRLTEWAAASELLCEVDVQKIQEALESPEKSRSEKAKEAPGAVKCSSEFSDVVKQVCKAVVGLQADFSKVFFLEGEAQKLNLSNEDKIEEFLSGHCPDEGLPLFEAIQGAYYAYLLAGIMRGSTGGTISQCMVQRYKQYGRDLDLLKGLFKSYAPERFDEFFRGEMKNGRYAPRTARGYTAYNIGASKLSYDDLKKQVEKVLKGTPAEQTEEYTQMMKGFDEGMFLRRQKTSDNGAIYFQLHLEEMRAIIDNQSKYYPFLAEESDKLQSLVTFRIPYYVGPLTQKNAAKDAAGRNRFAWSERKPGMENTPVRPWNWEDVIDRHKSAEKFMRRLTGTCTYLYGESVLPKCSILYERFCVLNELNGSWWTQDEGKRRPFTEDQRMMIVDRLFGRGRVTYKAVADLLKQEFGSIQVSVGGGQGETGYESKLSSYLFFCQLLGVDDLSESDEDMAEQIILWNTLFEDRAILREKLQVSYGDRLNADQIKRVCKKRFTGWGRLSQKLLTGVRVDIDGEPKSVMDVLIEGRLVCGEYEDASSRDVLGSPMVLMQILNDQAMGFKKRIEEINHEKLMDGEGLSVQDLPGSSAIRRSVNQALRIVKEIASIAGTSPSVVYVEVTREEDERKKGRNTKRHKRVELALKALGAQGLLKPGIMDEFKGIGSKDLDERLSLYFMQNGKCLYCGEPIDIRELSSPRYQVDHILPQAYIKDDSLENKALVNSHCNQRKTDSLLLDQRIIGKMRGTWGALKEAGLIGEKKYANLTRERFSDKQLRGFIARQIVETSQSIKLLQLLLRQEFPDTKVVPIKAGLSSVVRKRAGLHKCRALNDYHHAHDALLAVTLGRYLQECFPKAIEEPIRYAKAMRKFFREEGEEGAKPGKAPGSTLFLLKRFLSVKKADDGETMLWDSEMEIERLRTYLNYKTCYISRMPIETTGAFWDATIYSPEGGKKIPTIPIKKELPPEVYGGYSREQFAYFFIYRVLDKKKRPALRFDAVPVSVAAKVAQGGDGLVEFARGLAKSNGEEFVSIEVKRLAKHQLIEIDGDRLSLRGLHEVRNASQIAFTCSEAEKFNKLFDPRHTDEVDPVELFNTVANRCEVRAPKAFEKIGLASYRGTFDAASRDDQVAGLRLILDVISGHRNQIDMRPFGGKQFAGEISFTFRVILNDASRSFCIIRQSVTGMFESRREIGL